MVELQDRAELDAGGEEAAVLADRRERAVQLGGARAAAVAEQPEVVPARSGHPLTQGVRG